MAGGAHAADKDAAWRMGRDTTVDENTFLTVWMNDKYSLPHGQRLITATPCAAGRGFQTSPSRSGASFGHRVVEADAWGSKASIRCHQLFRNRSEILLHSQ